jgi:outer membrane protein assembly factor BamB
MNPATVRHRRAATGALVALVACVLAAPAGAVSSRTWKQRDRADFEQGEPQGVSLLAEGPIRLGARLEAIFEPDQPYIWAVASGPGGVVYAAGGNEGVVYRIEPGKAAAPFFTVEEPEVLALAVDGNGAIYAGSSPGGRVYKFNPDGKLVWRTDTLEQYIWALQFDRKGSLYAATGTQGRVLLIGKDGSSRVHFDSAETHVRTLALDRDGNLLAGTDGHGLILRITPDGKGTVLYDAPLTEVVALAPAADGSLYAAVAGEAGRSRGSSSASRGSGGSSDSSGDGSSSSQSSSQDSNAQSQAAEQKLSVTMEGKVLSISPDGYAREVWSGSQEAILSLARLDNGSVLLGSSGQGKLYLLDTKGTLSEVGRTSASQVTALLPRPAGKGGSEIVVAGSNLGGVAILKPGYLASGKFESKVFDAQSFATWGRIAWRADLPSGTNVAFQTRSGNTEEPDRTWSDWSPEQSQPVGGRVESPSARFLQWRALLSSKDPALTPELREVGVVYMQKNLPPEFRKIEVLPVGVTLQEVPAANAGQGPETPKSGTDSDAATRHRPRPTSRRGFDAGARSISWQVVDPNEDDLIYDVQYRAIDEKNWKTVRRAIDEDFVTFDGAALPDGTYLVRVIASDALSNPSGSSLTAEKVSPPFDVDNTPPRIDRLKAQMDHGTLKVSFEANDGFSVVREASYSVDAGDWMPARPEDGLSDSAAEMFEIEIPMPPAGECSIVVRAVDSAGNVGAGRTVVEVPPPAQASSR